MRRSKAQRVRDKRAAQNTDTAPKQSAETTKGGDNPKAPASAKRVRQDTVSPRGQPKKPRLERRSEPNLSFADAAKADLMVAVTTMTTGHLSSQQAQEVQDILRVELVKLALEPSEDTICPRFRGKPVHTSGALKLWCADQLSLTWLTKLLERTSLESGEKLVLKKQSELSRRVRCGILFPGPWEDMATVGRTLRFQNKWANVDRWLLYTSEAQQAGTFAIVGIPEDVVELLLERGRELNFVIGSVYVKFQGPKGKFYEQPPTQREEVPEACAATETEKVAEPQTATKSGLPQQRTSASAPSGEQGDDEDALLEPSEDGDTCAQGLGNLVLGEEDAGLMSEDDGIPFPTM